MLNSRNSLYKKIINTQAKISKTVAISVVIFKGFAEIPGHVERMTIIIVHFIYNTTIIIILRQCDNLVGTWCRVYLLASLKQILLSNSEQHISPRIN